MLAILAVALATLAPFAMAAEGSGDNNADGNKQPTLAELGNKVDLLVRQLNSLTATTGTLRTELGTALSAIASAVGTLSSNHAALVAKVDAFASRGQQMAVVLGYPTATRPAGRTDRVIDILSPRGMDLYLVGGDSSIAGFPSGAVDANGKFTDATLPAGTYLFELQQPYSDNVLCLGSVSRHNLRRVGGVAARGQQVCPTMRLDAFSSNRSTRKLQDGSGIYTFAAPESFRLHLKIPSGFTLTDDRPIGSYVGAVKITKLK